MGPSVFEVLVLGCVQGMAELLPVSSSAHVILMEKILGLDPSAPEMTFILVMLHTGTMFAVLGFFWKRWLNWNKAFWKQVILATAVTGILGLILKKAIEVLILEKWLGESHAEIEHLFKSLPLMSFSLFAAGCLIWLSGRLKTKAQDQKLDLKTVLLIGAVQGLCLPFRGFSRSGVTISTGLLCGKSRQLSEDFSFALALAITPAVIVWETLRLYRTVTPDVLSQTLPLGVLGALAAGVCGAFALRVLSGVLESGRWKWFGVYCFVFSGVLLLYEAMSHFN